LSDGQVNYDKETFDASPQAYKWIGLSVCVWIGFSITRREEC